MTSETTATSDAPEALAGPAERGALWTLLSVVVVDLIGFAIVIPVLPFYAESYGASALVLGLLVTSFAAMQFLFSPVWGRLSDRVGRRPVMLWTIAGTALALLALGLADSLAWLFVARILGGAFGANISVATAYVTDLTAASERTKWMGLIGASFGVGFVLGPALAGVFSRWGYGAPALAGAGLAALNFGWAWFRLKEPVRHREAAGERPSPRVVLADPFVRRLCLLNFLFTFAVSQLETVFAFFMLHRFGYDVGQVASLMVLMAVVMVAVQGGGIRPLAKRFGERNLLLGGSGLLALACATIPLAPTVLLLLVPLVVSSLGRAVAYPSMLSLVSTGTGSTNRGAVMGGFQSAAALARVGGPLAAGALYELEPGWPFLLAAGLLAVVALAASPLGVQAAGAVRRSPLAPAALLAGVVLLLASFAVMAVRRPAPNAQELYLGAMRELSLAEVRGVKPVVEGRQVVLEGKVSSEAMRERAVAAVAAMPGVSRVDNRLEVLVPAPAAPWVFLDLRWQPDGLAIRGRLATEAERLRFGQRARELVGFDRVEERIEVDGSLPSPAWLEPAAGLLEALLGQMPAGRVKMGDGRVALFGEVASEEVRAALEAKVAAALPALALESRLTVAAPAAGSGIISPAANAAPSKPAR